jgi:hypothetical protein
MQKMRIGEEPPGRSCVLKASKRDLSLFAQVLPKSSGSRPELFAFSSPNSATTLAKAVSPRKIDPITGRRGYRLAVTERRRAPAWVRVNPESVRWRSIACSSFTPSNQK